MFRPNEIFSGVYQILGEIGRGGTGVVYKAYHLRLQKYVVIKRIRTDFTGSLEARTEVDILKNLHHPCLPQVYDFLQQGQEVYTVMDFIDGQDLDHLIALHVTYDEKTLRRWLHQLLDVLDYLHSQHPPIIHSDIKPGNIILTPQGNVCLIDFNISLDDAASGKITGFSRYYAAPEQVRLAQACLSGQPCGIRLDARTDLYSLAATFYTLVSGCIPATDRGNPPLQQIEAGRYTPEFLAILDRAMAWSPYTRYPSARKMQAALERLKRQDRRYNTYIVLQAVSWLSAALLLAGGIFCVVRGLRVQNLERYRAAYQMLSQAVEQGNDDAILTRGEALLQGESYQDILRQTPQDRSAILHALGDCYYNRQDYTQAAAYYQEALENAPPDDTNLEQYYEDAAIAQALAGNTDAAQRLLSQAAEAGVSSSRQQLMEASIALQQGDSTTCIQVVQQVLAGTQDAALCARACLLAATALQDQPEQALEWLQAANDYASSRETLRRLGAACMELAAAESRQQRAQQWRQQALTCYQSLCGYTYPAIEDRINLAVVELSLGDTDTAIQQLTALLQERPEDYRIEANLAFAYDAAGDSQKAAASGSHALRLWRETPATDGDSADSDLIQNLLELQKRLGF